MPQNAAGTASRDMASRTLVSIQDHQDAWTSVSRYRLQELAASVSAMAQQAANTATEVFVCGEPIAEPHTQLLGPLTRRMLAANSGLSEPASAASYASRRTAASRPLLVDAGASPADHWASPSLRRARTGIPSAPWMDIGTPKNSRRPARGAERSRHTKTGRPRSAMIV